MFNFLPNLNFLDRSLRFTLGIVFVLISRPFYDVISSDLISYISLVFGIMNIVTGVVCWCVVYAILGISSKSDE